MVFLIWLQQQGVFRKSGQKILLFPLLLLGLYNQTFCALGQVSVPFPSTSLQEGNDYSDLMVKGIARFLDSETERAILGRQDFWEIDFSDKAAYSQSVAPNRERLAQIIGAMDLRLPNVEMEYIATASVPAKVAENEKFITYAVRWEVFKGVYGEGLMLQPKGKIKAKVVAIPDADQTPELLIGLERGLLPESQYARLLAENGCQVVIPTIINRNSNGSGSQRMDRYTNQPHREWIYRQAYTFGRHVIGYEVQKILAAVDWFADQKGDQTSKIGVVGWGEGALLGFYSAALDPRIEVSLISGYFSKRDNLWEEPIYRNVFGLLAEFGDAEIASLIVPRSLIIEYSAAPDIKGPPKPLEVSSRLGASAAPGKIITPAFEEVEGEVERAKQLSGKFRSSIQFVHDNRKVTKALEKGSLMTFLNQLQPGITSMAPLGEGLSNERINFDSEERQLRQVRDLENHTQKLIEKSRHVRDAFFWDKMEISTPETWEENTKHFKNYFWDRVIGRIPTANLPLNPKSKQIFDEPTWTGHEITLDVLPDIFAWGYLLLPKDIQPGETRPTIVVQHGGSGVPAVVMDKSHKAYKGLAVQLVELGYIVFAPHFPWRAGDDYRSLQRRANPLGLSVFSVILNQHEKILGWLKGQPWVDPDRIGLYGLSWGGKVAVRVPALLDGYSLSICSGDFNEWIWKNATTDWPNSYMFVPEYEMFDFNLGMTFNYGEMAALIAPRAFMVERGHDDGVGIDEWVAFEYAKVNRLYNKLKIPDRTEIEYFDGGHEIHAHGTLKFLQQHFDWPLAK